MGPGPTWRPRRKSAPAKYTTQLDPGWFVVAKHNDTRGHGRRVQMSSWPDDDDESAEPSGSKVGPTTKRETKYDAEGNFDVYRQSVQKSMEKPYPENGGFYGVGSLREMGMRKSRHSGDWRTKSTFQNKEEEFNQPLKGSDTVLEKGITIRGAGGVRVPTAKTGDGAGSAFQEPMGGHAGTAQNIALIRSLGKTLTLPQSVQERRTFEEVSVQICVLRSPSHRRQDTDLCPGTFDTTNTFCVFVLILAS